MCLQYKSFENTVGKGEIAHNKQFLLFLQCFLPFCRTFHLFCLSKYCHLQALSIWKGLKFVVWGRLKINDNFVFDKVENVFRLRRNCRFSTLSFIRVVKTQGCVSIGQCFITQSRLLTTLRKKPFEKIIGKGELLETSIFSFSQCFLIISKQISITQLNLFSCLQVLLI